ncbi:MAG: helix-turn-helix domain-containing protein [Okeania sp. SIO3C4]|nr:helix-turn-helix domain-containing protein [Okeania sp. SIO3C4]
MSKKLYHVDLTFAEQSELSRLIHKGKTSSLKVKRAYILLAVDRNGDKCWTDKQVSVSDDASIRTIENLRKRFVLEGFAIALHGKKREVFKEKILTGEVEAHLMALRCSPTPSGYASWTYRLLADKMVELGYVEHISHESVRQLLKKTNSNLGA